MFSPIASSILLGLLLLAPRLIIQAPNTATWMVYLKRGFWLVGLLMVLESLVLSQTRGAWLASALIFPVALLFRYKASLIRFPRLSVRSLVALALVIGLAGLWFQHNIATIINRVNSEQIMAKPEISKQQILGQEVLLTTSVGYRKILWEIGWRKAQERWLFGWGPGTTEALLKQEHNPLFSQSVTLQNGTVETLHLYHLHNLYLEFLVRFGRSGRAHV